jgi:phosphoglycolate phosphatase
VPPPITVVFDLDGTLIDTAPDLVRCTNHVLTSKGLPTVEAKVVRAAISHGARAMIHAGLQSQGIDETPSELDRLYRLFLEHYADTIAHESRPFPGLLATLDRLAEEGARLAVCTNKVERNSLKLLELLGLRSRFAAIAGFDTFAVAKPHPDHLLLTIDRAGGDRARAVMVGDSATDIRTAKAARVPVIAVSFGYTETPVRELGPDAVIDHYDEFGAALQGVLRKRD